MRDKAAQAKESSESFQFSPRKLEVMCSDVKHGGGIIGILHFLCERILPFYLLSHRFENAHLEAELLNAQNVHNTITNKDTAT